MDIENKLNELYGRMLKSFKSDPGTLSPFSSSSSQHTEQNDNHLEHYVKQTNDMPNTENVSDMFNSTNGGTKMENTQYETPAAVTTEPDSQGEQAITKVIDQVTRPEGNVSVSDAPEGPVPTNATYTPEGSAIAPTSEEMAEPVEKAENGKCKSCGQDMPIEKSADEAEAPKEEAKETPKDEKEEIKKSHSVWDGAFAPTISRGI